MAASVFSPTKVLPEIIRRLNAKHPDARYEIDWETPLQLLVGTILAAQWTDENVNKLTPRLFAKYPDARAFAKADVAKLAEDLKPATFHNNKAKSIQGRVPGSHHSIRRRSAADDGRDVDVARRGPQVGQRGSQQRLSPADRDHRRYTRRSGQPAHGPDHADEAGKDRNRPDETGAEGRMGAVRPRDGPARSLHMQGPRSRLPQLRHERSLSQDRRRPNGRYQGENRQKTGGESRSGRRTAKAAPVAAAAPTAVGGSLAEQLAEDWRRVLAAEFTANPTSPSWKSTSRPSVSRRRSSRRSRTCSTPSATRPTIKSKCCSSVRIRTTTTARRTASVSRSSVSTPPSLVNIYKELQTDLGCKPASHGYLTSWARAGRPAAQRRHHRRAHTPGAHKDQGWETFTDAVIRVNARSRSSSCSGGRTHRRRNSSTPKRHIVLATAHPSPLSAKKFFGSKPFSQANAALEKAGRTPIDWQLPTKPDADGPGETASAKSAPKAVPAPASNRTTPATVAEPPAKAAREPGPSSGLE